MENSEVQKNKGLVVCNIGMGKGKTTAAMGIAARASGAGLNVFILQFVKAKPPLNVEDAPLQDEDRKDIGEWPVSNEIKFFNAITIPQNFGTIETEICGLGFVGILGDQKDKDAHVDAAKQGLLRAQEILQSKKYDVVIFDEILSAIEVSLISEDDVVAVLTQKPDETHVVITGHNRFPKVLALCDTVTEMKMIKHGYYEGILAQEGIDY